MTQTDLQIKDVVMDSLECSNVACNNSYYNQLYSNVQPISSLNLYNFMRLTENF